MQRHQVVPADHEPDLLPVACVAPGQTPGAPPQGRDEPTQGAIPAFHEGHLDHRAELTPAQLLTKTARAAVHPSPLDLHDMAHLVADLHDLGIEQVFGGHESWFGLAAHFPTASWTIHAPHALKQGCSIGLPPVSEKERECLSTSNDLCDQHGRCV